MSHRLLYVLLGLVLLAAAFTPFLTSARTAVNGPAVLTATPAPDTGAVATSSVAPSQDSCGACPFKANCDKDPATCDKVKSGCCAEQAGLKTADANCSFAPASGCPHGE